MCDAQIVVQSLDVQCVSYIKVQIHCFKGLVPTEKQEKKIYSARVVKQPFSYVKGT